MDLLRCSRSFALMKLITHGVAAYKLVNELVLLKQLNTEKHAPF